MDKTGKMNRKLTVFFLCIGCLMPVSAHAYLDPGTGSMLLTTFVALFAGFYIFIKGVYYKGLSGMLALFGIRRKHISRVKFVVYSEGKQYWNTFKSLLDEFDKNKTHCLFLTSDISDSAFKYNSPYIETKFIGTGNKAYITLNFLEADVCIMTTPGLDVLQIKRSKGVKHYCHLIHSPADIHTYKLFSFDYYDSVFTSGLHQEHSLRELEAERKTAKKEIVRCGCLYYDEMVKEKSGSGNLKLKTTTLLIAPSWGKNGLLSKYGLKIIEPLIRGNIQIILRPHPQSFISEPEIIESILKRFSGESNFTFDENKNGVFSMQKADILLSDFSAIVFDFAFVFQKPVLTMDFELNPIGFEADDLGTEPWEIGIFEKIGHRINENEIDRLPVLVEQYAQSSDFSTLISKTLNESVFHFGHAAPVAYKDLISISHRFSND